MHTLSTVRPLQFNFKFNANAAMVADVKRMFIFCNRIHRTEINLMSIGTTVVTSGLSHTRRKWCTISLSRLTKYTNRPRSIEINFIQFYYFLIIHSDQFKIYSKLKRQIDSNNQINKKKKTKNTLAIAISQRKPKTIQNWMEVFLASSRNSLIICGRTKRLCVSFYDCTHCCDFEFENGKQSLR